MRPVACSMTAKTYRRAPVSVRVSKKSQASSASAWLRRKSTPGRALTLRRGRSAVLPQDFPDGRGGDLDAQGGELFVDSAVAP
jgi:hypothetical protein